MQRCLPWRDQATGMRSDGENGGSWFGARPAFHKHREGVNSFSLGTTADAHNSFSRALSDNERQTMTPYWAILPEAITERILQSNTVNPMNWIGMEETWFCSKAFK